MTHPLQPCTSSSRCWLLISAAALSPALAEEPAYARRRDHEGQDVTQPALPLRRCRPGRIRQRGKASTLRTTLGYRTLAWKRLAAHRRVRGRPQFGFSNDHNNLGAGSLWNGVTDRPVIPDPPITEINQVYLDWKPLDTLPIRGGRQEIVVDNSRFIGNVGWRQNHQSFDAAKVRFTGVKNLDLGLPTSPRQRTVTGASNPMSTSPSRASTPLPGVGTVRGYFLSIDYDQDASWHLSTRTYGASFAGKARSPGSSRLTYRLELATQATPATIPKRVEADYIRADLGLVIGKVTVGAGYEVLGGGDDGSFNTPLATLHKFNGWADKFLATPADGLSDFFMSARCQHSGLEPGGVYHDFSADSGGASWGSEFDARSSTRRRGSRRSR